MKRVAIHTLGCKANQADSDSLGMRFLEAGCEIVRSTDVADAYIINTCTVTSKAAYQSRQMIRRIIRREPDAMVIVMGCDVVAEREVLEKIEGATCVKTIDEALSVITRDMGDRVDLNNRARDDQHVIASECEAIQRDGSGDCHGRSSLAMTRSHDDVSVIARNGVTKQSSEPHLPVMTRARPFVRIQDGCENFCSYCIVPYVRGPLKSVPVDNIVDAVEKWSKAGYYEVVLTGIHIGKYGIDLKGDQTLAMLLEEVLSRTTISRLRLSSIEPDEMSDELIRLISRSNRICPHLHIPLQSGSDATLKRMKRGYTTADYRSCIDRLKKEIPNLSLGTDLITGFPGESEEEYQETRRFVESLPITYLHVFSYSDREGTEAYRMTDKIHDSIKHRRTAEIREMSRAKRTHYLEKNMGQTVTVVFDKKKIGEYWKGVSENYIQVLVKDRNISLNHETVCLEKLQDERVIGRCETEINSEQSAGHCERRKGAKQSHEFT